ncbi:MAG: cytidylate kinase family protein [bacterium]
MNRRLNILILDDEEIVCTRLKPTLEKAGYFVETFTDSRRVSEILEQRRFDVLITDLKMPHIDGMQLFEIAKNRWPDIQVIIITGFATNTMAIITISRGSMSGGKKLAEMLAAKLGYRCVSREIILETASDYGVPEEKLFGAIRKNPSILQKLTFEREHYLAFIQATLCEFAKDDNLIYHGHAGHFLLEGISHVLRIRILACLSYRIKEAMDEFKLSEKDATKYINKVDKQRVKWTKFLYGKDWTSPELYDIVYNLENLDLDFVCEQLEHAVKQPKLQATPESTKAMQDLLIASKVRAALARLPEIRLEHIVVQADGGSVVIRGRTMSESVAEAIPGTALSVPGVQKVENLVEIDYRSYKIE